MNDEEKVIYKMENNSAMKKDEFLSFVTTWIIVLGEISQAYMWNVNKLIEKLREEW